MSVGSEFHRSDAATGKEHRPTVVSRNGVDLYNDQECCNVTWDALLYTTTAGSYCYNCCCCRHWTICSLPFKVLVTSTVKMCSR